MDKFYALYKLTRVGTIMDSFPILMLVAFIASRINFSFIVVTAIVVNLMLLIFSYMINDIEDAEDDRLDLKKKARNPLSAGTLTYFEAYFATAMLVMISILVLLTFGTNVLLVGLTILGVGFLYSWKRIRLKSRPVLDILSHGYFLAAAQVLFFALLPGAHFDFLSVIMVIGVYIFSMGGDLYNESRDWEVDQKAGLHNTANLLGLKLTKSLIYVFWCTGGLMVASTCVLLLISHF